MFKRCTESGRAELDDWAMRRGYVCGARPVRTAVTHVDTGSRRRDSWNSGRKNPVHAARRCRGRHRQRLQVSTLVCIVFCQASHIIVCAGGPSPNASQRGISHAALHQEALEGRGRRFVGAESPRLPDIRLLRGLKSGISRMHLHASAVAMLRGNGHSFEGTDWTEDEMDDETDGSPGPSSHSILQYRGQAQGQDWGRDTMDGAATGIRRSAPGGGGRRAGQVCPDCGPRCIETKVAKPMRGECVGPTGVKFYEGAEVRPGQPLWRVQYAPLRQCVRTHGQANRRAGEREGRLSRLTPTLLTKSVNDVQGECRQFWKDIASPPTFMYTCNDPLGTEEAQIAGYTLEEFDQSLIDTFRQAVASAMNNLKQNNSDLNVLPNNVAVQRTFVGTSCSSLGKNETKVNGNVTTVTVTEVTLVDNPCTCNVGDSHKVECPTVCCDNKLRGDVPGIRVHFRITGLQARQQEVDQVLYGADVLGLEIEKEFGEITGTFPEISLRSGRDATPCGGLIDKKTCLMGDVCRPITERGKFTSFVSRDWWIRTDKKWYGGSVPPQMKVREWYCDYDPRLFVGKVRLGQLGYTDFYLRNSNLHVKSECDNHEEYDITLQNGISKSGTGEIAREDSGLDPNRHCANVNTTDPVPADCCGYCFLSNIHIAKLFDCTGMQDILNNDEAIRVLAKYCVTTRLCREARPCYGEPVKMGDPFALLRATTYEVYCDPLDRGCKTPYINGRPVKKGERACGYAWACDHRIHSIRLRIGYFFNDTSIFEPPPDVSYYVMSAGVAVAITLTLICCSACIFLYYRRWKFIHDKKKRREEKAKAKFARKREARTANDVQLDFGDD